MKEALKRIRGEEKLQTNFDVRVIKANLIDKYGHDFIELEVEENGSIFKNITLIKGEIYPLPNEGDFLNIKELYYDYDNLLIFRLFGKAEIGITSKNNIISGNKEIFDFSYNAISKSIKNICNIKEDLHSNLFTLDSKDENFSYLFCLNDLKLYKISNNLIPPSFKGDFFLITNYILNTNEILGINITIIKRLNDEEKIFQCFYRFGKGMSLFKVIDIDENNYICIDDNRKIYLVEKSEELGALDIKLCQLLIVNYKIGENSKTLLNKIKLDKKLIIKISSQDLYFSKLLPINHISVVYINFLDYRINNIYDTIIINEKKLKINSNEMYHIVSTSYRDFDFYPINISLLKSDDINSTKNFCFILFQGLLNKINAFINFTSEKPYFIEYFIMSIDIPLIKIKTKISIEINKIQYELNHFDTFQSENRKRINCLNVPFQQIENFEEKNLKKINSIQICKIFNQNTNMIFGIFDINEMNSKSFMNDNSYFDDYYSDFGNIINLFEDKNISKKELKDLCLKIYEKSKIEKSKDKIISTYCDELTLSQYKTRIGLLLCYYTKLNIKEFRELKGFYDYIKDQIDDAKITLLQRLRIIIFYLDKKLHNSGSINDIIFLSELNKNSPYVLADELNKNEIKNLTEFSRYFAAYLQLNSFILKNYYINEPSYSFSLELLFVMKHYLLSSYEDFIFTSSEQSGDYTYMSELHDITVINEQKIFSKEINYESIRKLDDPNLSKDFAIPISFVFKQEKYSHQKRRNKNQNIFTPFAFYKDGKLERIKQEIKINKDKIIEKRENGRMLESYLSEDNKVLALLKNIPIFGELANHIYYIQKDFSELMNKFEEIKEKKKKYFIDKKDSLNKLFDIFDKKEKNTQLKKEEISELYDKKLKEEGKVRIGDIHYSKEEFDKYVENWKIKNSFA